MSTDEKKGTGSGIDGNGLIASGLGVGAVGALGALVVGAACPLCIVATPALLGAGLVQKWRERSKAAEAAAREAPPQSG
ncbi:MAG TPA: hypothetical protein VFO83_07400 [Aggregicoccus sp.]|nr:hypothetical protein [Aggregicoccus sp.]